MARAHVAMAQLAFEQLPTEVFGIVDAIDGVRTRRIDTRSCRNARSSPFGVTVRELLLTTPAVHAPRRLEKRLGHRPWRPVRVWANIVRSSHILATLRRMRTSAACPPDTSLGPRRGTLVMFGVVPPK